MNLPQFRQQIAADLAGRVANFQQTILAARQKGLLGSPQSPLKLLVDGDSWFDYPLGGTLPLVDRTDVIAQLPALCGRAPFILNLAHYGDATTTELGLEQTQKLIGAIKDPANGGFDAILFSGGGDDVAGNSFCIWLNDAADVSNKPAFGINAERFNAVLSVIRASYLDLISLRNDHLAGAPVFVHAYDFAIPSGQGACPNVGPWLKPALDYCGWTNPADAAQIVHDALSQLGAVIAKLAADPANNMIYVQTQGTLAANQWANELHPTPAGFRLIAGKFKDALAAYPSFQGRV